MTSEQGHTVGSLVAGRFRLVARLGAGGMGTVWQAHDLTLEREVALKEMRSGNEDPDRADLTRARVLREARALARVNHANAVTVYEVVDYQPYPWLVMELVTGRSLQDVLGDGPLSPGRAARIALDVLGALQAAHAAGILHRDVKPGNVLVRPDGTAVLTDFGIAALQGSQTLTAPGDIIGSPEYMAPERIRGEAAGPASDLWSLGMLLYVCVEGDNPMRRDSVWETLLAVCDRPLPTPTRAGPLTPVIDALLARAPEHRPSAPRLASLLRDVAASESATRPITRRVPPTLREQPAARPSPEHQDAARRRRRLPVVLAAVTGAAVAAATVAAFTVPGLLTGPTGTETTAAPADSEAPATEPGGWIAQLSAIPHTVNPAERDQELAALQQQVPGATLLDGDNWGSLPSGYWIVRAPATFADGYEALAYCATYGPEQCSGRYLSDDHADRPYLCEPAPTPDPTTCRRSEDQARPPTAGPA
ncbi:serine/threonine-protein kinase [Streptomyces sp. NRRL S-350]|uniref:serine/threonine-protein kinase n=1 Tax=Streptomyces sp. NRRL S-350 TaxID=1463902 RepID=UPI0007C46F9F|nr:serine/threonine-protein kinase [Streptomyces sp. NRRL S-350]